jgi:hypothetical protein
VGVSSLMQKTRGQRIDLILRVVKSEGRAAGSRDAVAREQRRRRSRRAGF